MWYSGKSQRFSSWSAGKMLCLAFFLFFFLEFDLAPVSAEPVTLRVWNIGEETARLPELIQIFEAENPDVRIQLQSLSWDDSYEKVLASLLGSNPPDVCQIDEFKMLDFQEMGALAPMDDFLAEGEPARADFLPESLATATFDGKVYAIPWYVDIFTIYYRKDILSRFGRTEFPRDWAGFEALGDEVMADHKARGEKSAYFCSLSGYEFDMFYWQAGGKYRSPRADEDFFDEDAMTAAFEFHRRLKKKGLFGSEEGSGLYESEEMNLDRLACIQGGPWTAEELKRKADQLSFEWDVAPLPGWKNNLSYFGGSFWVVFQDSPRQEAARRFIRFMSRPAVQHQWYELSANLPAHRKTYNFPELKNDPVIRVVREQMESIHNCPRDVQYSIFWDQYESKVAALLDSDRPIRDFVREMNMAMRRIVADYDSSRFPRLSLAAWILACLFPLVLFTLYLVRGRPLQLLHCLTGSTLISRRFRRAMGFLLPALLLILLFRLLPLSTALVASFTDLDARSVRDYSQAHFVGLANYGELTGDEVFRTSIWNTMLFTLIGVPLNLALALALAIFLQSLKGWRRTLFGLLFFLPSVVNIVASAVTWSWVYDPNNPVNRFVAGIFEVQPVAFLGQPGLALPALIVFSIWRTFGLNMIIILAGLQAVSLELYDAVRVDGGGRWAQFCHVTLPGISRTLFVVALGTTVAHLQFFVEPYVLTGGGPKEATMSAMLFIYYKTFLSFRLGYSASVIYVCFAFFVAFNWLQTKVRRRLDA